MHIFGIPRVHRVLLSIWFPLTPTVLLILDLVKRRRGPNAVETSKEREEGRVEWSDAAVVAHHHVSFFQSLVSFRCSCKFQAIFTLNIGS